MVRVEQTPNPNALKFTVGLPVGGPTTVRPGEPAEDEALGALAELDGVTSVFATSDFVTLTKSSDGDWAVIAPVAKEILEARFSA